MLEAKHVVKTFDGFRALDGLTMTVPTGAVYGLVGPNGAGKSTIIRHLAGIYRQDSGEVLLDGQPVYEDPARSEAADPPPVQGYAEAGGLLADGVLYAGVPHSGRAGGRSGPRHAAAGLVAAFGRRG